MPRTRMWAIVPVQQDGGDEPEDRSQCDHQEPQDDPEDRRGAPEEGWPVPFGDPHPGATGQPAAKTQTRDERVAVWSSGR